MCQLCIGSHKVKVQNNYVFSIHSCPKCGPLPETERNLRRARFKKRLEEAMTRLEEKEHSA